MQKEGNTNHIEKKLIKSSRIYNFFSEIKINRNKSY